MQLFLSGKSSKTKSIMLFKNRLLIFNPFLKLRKISADAFPPLFTSLAFPVHLDENQPDIVYRLDSLLIEERYFRINVGFMKATQKR